MNIRSIRKNNVKIAVSMLITSVIMGVSSISIYSNISTPKFQKEFLTMAIKYLEEGNYEEAILSFNKIIKIDEKNIEARLGLANAYIGINDNDKAIEILKEAQSIDIENAKLLLDILEILKDIDLDIAYEILQNYINKVGESNIDNNINEIIELSKEDPTNPVLNLKPGKYVSPIELKLVFDEIRVGHSYYYTIDGSEPNENSNKYSGSIKIDKDTIIKLIGYNKENKSTEIIELEYLIDLEEKNKLEKLVKESEDLINKTKVGTEVGNVDKSSKEKLSNVINKCKKVLENNTLSYEEFNSIYNELNIELSNFKNNIIKPTDTSKLESAINEAQNLYNNSTEGSNDGQYKVGSKSTLMEAINKAKRVYENNISKQEDIDFEVTNLKNSINKFKSDKVEGFTKSKAVDYFANYFGISLKKESSGIYTYSNDYKSFMFKMTDFNEVYGNKQYRIMHGYVTNVVSEGVTLYICEDKNVYMEDFGDASLFLAPKDSLGL